MHPVTPTFDVHINGYILLLPPCRSPPSTDKVPPLLLLTSTINHVQQFNACQDNNMVSHELYRTDLLLIFGIPVKLGETAIE